MTIFLIVLKKLIREQLKPVSNTLLVQSKSYGYNKQLSLDQKDIIDHLEEEVLKFEGTGDDESDTKTMVVLIESHRAKIQLARERHGKPREEGATITCISNLIFHSNGFLSKLKTFNFPLLNKLNTETPEGIIYYHAAYYFGEEIFNPLASIDLHIRAKKEEALHVRLQSLSEIIKPSHTLDERKERAMRHLMDLASDNKASIKPAKSSVAVPGVSFWGIQATAPTEWFAPSLGRFDEQFSQAARKIKEMTEESFKPDGDVASIAPAPKPLIPPPAPTKKEAPQTVTSAPVLPVKPSAKPPAPKQKKAAAPVEMPKAGTPPPTPPGTPPATPPPRRKGSTSEEEGQEEENNALSL